jgi:hypothetical protein
MSGDTDDCFVTEEGTGGLWGKIVLTEMNPISFKSEGYVYPIVYYDAYATLTGDM